jgi:TatD DNase family protein
VTEPGVDDLCNLAASHDKVIAIGETGLDYYRLNGRSLAEMAWQRERFRVHIRAARALNLPLVVHTRSSSDDTLSILKEEGAGQVRGVFHCFTETAEVARAALALGFHISFSGILTFRNAQALRDVAALVPVDRLLIETDSPYLAPMPHRGKTNSPAWVPYVAAELARVRGCSTEDVAQATTHNFEQLFGVCVPALASR